MDNKIFSSSFWAVSVLFERPHNLSIILSKTHSVNHRPQLQFHLSGFFLYN